MLKKYYHKTAFIKKNELKVTGKDLIELGISQDDVGSILEELYQLIIEGKIKNKRERLIEYVINNKIPSGDSKIILNKA